MAIQDLINGLSRRGYRCSHEGSFSIVCRAIDKNAVYWIGEHPIDRIIIDRSITTIYYGTIDEQNVIHEYGTYFYRDEPEKFTKIMRKWGVD